MPLLRGGHRSRPTTLVDVRGVVPRGIDGAHDRRRHDARRARGDADDPGRAPRGVPARRVPAAPEHGHARRQPAPVDALLVLAAQVAVPPARRRRRASRARASTASTRSSRTTSAPRRTRPTSRRRCSRSARRCAPTGASCRSRELYRLPTEDDRRTTTLEPGELILAVERAAVRRVGLPEGDGAQALGVPARRRRRRAARRRRRASRSPASRRSRGCSTSDGSTRRRRCRGTRTRSRSPPRSSSARCAARER